METEVDESSWSRYVCVCYFLFRSLDPRKHYNFKISLAGCNRDAPATFAPKDKFKVEGLNEIVRRLTLRTTMSIMPMAIASRSSDSNGNVAVYHKDN